MYSSCGFSAACPGLGASGRESVASEPLARAARLGLGHARAVPIRALLMLLGRQSGRCDAPKVSRGLKRSTDLALSRACLLRHCIAPVQARLLHVDLALGLRGGIAAS